jgi:hypothetical protein
VVAAIKHFRFMLEGRHFTVFTDHRPLVGALSRRSDPWLGRQQRHLSFIAEFSPTIRHIAGQSNVVADTLSRPASGQSGAGSLPSPNVHRAAANSGGTQSAPPVTQPDASSPFPSGGSRAVAKGRAEVKAPTGSSAHTFAANNLQAAAVLASVPPPSPPVDLAALAAAQLSCPDCQRAASSSVLRVTTIKMDNTSMMVVTSSVVFRPLVPAVFRRPIFEAIHNLAHPGIRATRRLIASRFVWPSLASQVAE